LNKFISSVRFFLHKKDMCHHVKFNVNLIDKKIQYKDSASKANYFTAYSLRAFYVVIKVDSILSIIF